METKIGLSCLLLQVLFAVARGVQVIQTNGDDSINYGDQMAIVDNKPINNVYYQLRRLPPPAPRPQMSSYEQLPPVTTVVRPGPQIIEPIPTPQVPNEIPLRRRGNFPECSLPPDAGDCTGEFIRIFFDDRRMSCEVFYYSGCGGNANRFTSIKACYDICSPHTATVKGPEVLMGKRYVIMPKPGAVDPPPPPPQMPAPSSVHPPFPHYDQEVENPSNIYYHPDSDSPKVPIPVPSGGALGEQPPQALQPTSIKVVKFSNRGQGFMNPGMMSMMGDNMFPNAMGMGMPANF